MNDYFELLTSELYTMLVSALPVIELRGGIPFGLTMGLSTVEAFTFAYIGSMLPVPFIMLFIRRVFRFLSLRFGMTDIIEKITINSLAKSEKVKKYGFWGLLIFIAIPLPGTGVWSGTLISVLLNFRFKLAFHAIAIGNLVAGIIIMVISKGFAWFIS